jgi:hypothetical protein
MGEAFQLLFVKELLVEAPKAVTVLPLVEGCR